MRRTGYNVLNDSQEPGGDEVDSGGCSSAEDLEAKQPFTDESHFNGGKLYKRTFCLVFTLFFGGLATLITSTLILLGHLDNETYADRMIPLMIISAIMFIPGAFYSRIIYKTYMKRPGFSYEQIPSCY